MSYFNWNLVSTPAPTYYTYILQPPMVPVTVGLPNQQFVTLQQQYPTLQQQMPTLQQQISTFQLNDGMKFIQQNVNNNAVAPSQFPVNIVQQIAANNVNRNVNIIRNIAPKPTLRKFEENSIPIIDVKGESVEGDENWNYTVKDEPEDVKTSQNEDDVEMKEENEEDNFDQAQIKEENDDTEENNEAEDGEEEEKKKTNQKQHRRVKTFKCGHCPYTTTWKGNLTKHIISKHTSLDEINWLNCDHCPYKGKTKDYLKCHLLHVHNVKVKWFDCPHCDFRAKLKCLLDRHTIINHPESMEIQWLECDQCSYKAKFKSNLKEHILSKHTKSSDIRWFHCAHCKFKAKRKRNLRFHLLNKHTADDKIQWFQCEFCPYRMFKRRAALKKHIAIVHEEEEKESQEKKVESRVVKEDTNKGDEDLVTEKKIKLESVEIPVLKKKVKQETKEIPVFIENRLCWKRIVVGSDPDDSFKCSQCNFRTADKEMFKKHILKYHVVTELKEEDQGLVKISYKTRDVIVMVDDVPCVKRILDHPLSQDGI